MKKLPDFVLDDIHAHWQSYPDHRVVIEQWEKSGKTYHVYYKLYSNPSDSQPMDCKFTQEYRRHK